MPNLLFMQVDIIKWVIFIAKISFKINYLLRRQVLHHLRQHVVYSEHQVNSPSGLHSDCIEDAGQEMEMDWLHSPADDFPGRDEAIFLA